MLKPLERDLNELVDNWNDHLIRHNRLSGCPSGVPNQLYEYPRLHGNCNIYYFKFSALIYCCCLETIIL